MEKLKKPNEKLIVNKKVRTCLWVMCDVVNLPIPASASLMQTNRVVQCIKAEIGHPEDVGRLLTVN